jgi:hypothetical protein
MTKVCENHSCKADISHKKSNAQFCSRSCKDVQASRRNYEQKESRRKVWRKKNPDKVALYKKKTKSSFGAAYFAKRRLSSASPTTDLGCLKGLSALALRINTLTNSQLQVDHIEPLISKEVCGLNTQHNLQLLSSGVNKAKSNRRDYVTPLEKIMTRKKTGVY